MTSLFLWFIFIFHVNFSSFSQPADSTAKQNTRPVQTSFKNEIYGGYGAVSVFNYTSNIYHTKSIYGLDPKLKTPRSFGIISLGYNRKISNVISLGVLFGYEVLKADGTIRLSLQSGGWGIYPITTVDRLVTGMANVTFSYLNKNYFHLYSGIGAGVTVDFAEQDVPVWKEKFHDNKLLMAGQVTAIGFRFGRALGGYVEAGFGTYGIVNAGISYRFTKPKSVAPHKDTISGSDSIKRKLVSFNEFYAGYSGLSFIYITGNFRKSSDFVKLVDIYDSRSAGTIFIGYNRSISRVVNGGLLLGFQHSQMSKGHDLYPFTFIGRFSVHYYTNPMISLYSGAGLGFTLEVGTEYSGNKRSTSFDARPAGAITLFGIRFGRTIGGFVELGAGTYGIVNAGLSYKFKDKK